MRRTLLAGAIAQAANAWWIDPAPSATDAVAMKELGDVQGWTPLPTTAPIHRDMIKRQAATQILGYLAPDNTCGYVAGRIGGIKTCEAGANCAAVIGTDSFYTMGCCGAGACTMQGVCYDYASMASCDQACRQDLNIVKCSGTAYPYCYPYSVPGMSMGFYSCDSVTTDSFQAFETTFDGQTGAATWLALRSADFDSLLADTSSATGTTRTRTSASESDSSSTSSRSPFTTTPVSPPDNENKKSTPIGAIVGGVVGGLAALAALVGVIVFLLFKKRKNKQAAAVAAAGAGPAPGTDPLMSQYNNAPPPSGPNNGGYFAPVAAGGKFDSSAAKYDGPANNGPMITESAYPGPTPVSPAPAYSAPFGSPPPPQDPRSSYVPPPQGYSEAPGATSYPPPAPAAQQPYYPPPGSQTANAPVAQAPVELGNTYAVPNQYQGRPVYEAA